MANRTNTQAINDVKTLGEVRRNFGLQYYKGIPLQQIDRGYGVQKARRFTLNHTNQNVWIPCKHLYTDGTIKPTEDIDYVFFQSKRQCEIAGIYIRFDIEDRSHYGVR